MAGDLESAAEAGDHPPEAPSAAQLSRPAPPGPPGRIRPGDPWFVWLLALAAIALPVVVLLCVGSIPLDRVTWVDVGTAAKRGDFLVPVLILCAETIRRWCREVKCGHFLIVVRIFAVGMCGLAGAICFSATVIAANVEVTRAGGDSLVTITWWCLVAAFVFGTWAVAVSGGEARGE
jgi:hypothetical protein